MRWIIAVPVLLAMALSFVAPAFAALGEQDRPADEYPAPIAPVVRVAPVTATSPAGPAQVREPVDLR